jgi:hypothetical protein
MTQDEIIEMAKQAGLTSVDKKSQYLRDCLERFAKLVAEKEREACALICDECFKSKTNRDYSDFIAICIRARG